MEISVQCFHFTNVGRLNKIYSGITQSTSLDRYKTKIWWVRTARMAEIRDDLSVAISELRLKNPDNASEPCIVHFYTG